MSQPQTAPNREVLDHDVGESAVIYYGEFHAGVCTPRSWPWFIVEAAANRGNRKGWWRISKGFPDGSTNPCPCDQTCDRVHYLLERR